jgi:hypothetical protein
MKRILAAVLGVLVLVGLSVTVFRPESASALPAAACRAHTSTQNNPASWRFSSTFEWHFTQRLYTTPGCNQIYFRSEGWRFDYYQCGEMWVRRYNSDGSSYVVDGSRKRVCGGATTMLISRIAGDRGFRIEGWSFDLNQRTAMIHPVGSVLY